MTTSAGGNARPSVAGSGAFVRQLAVLGKWMWVRWYFLAGVGLLLGCAQERPEWMVPPELDAKKIVPAIMDQADKDKSDSLEGSELSTIPALFSSLEALDQNSDKRLSRDEIVAWLERVKKDGNAQAQAAFTIRSRGKPVANAVVKLVPEACMGGAIEPAEGKTDDRGMVMLMTTTRDRQIMGARCGLYRMEVSGMDPSGTPISSKYGKNSPLGFAFGGGAQSPLTPVVNLD